VNQKRKTGPYSVRPATNAGDRPTVLPPKASRVLDRLRQCDGYISGESLSHEIGVSRNIVWRCIEALRILGYEIDSAPRRGYRLVGVPDTPFPWELRRLLHTQRVGRVCRFLWTTDSTNRVAAEFARAGAPDGAVVIADSQSAGRGRRGRRWHSPPGCNLYVSLLVRTDASPERIPQASLLAALALADAVEETAPEVRPAVKWPNDLYVAGRKAAGVLCEMHAEADVVHYLVIGVGVNVNLPEDRFPGDLMETATSLCAAAGRPVSRTALLAAFMNRFDRVWGIWLKEGFAPFRAEWARRSLLEGHDVAVETGGATIRGRAVGISGDGALLVSGRGGETYTVVSGDAHLADW